MTAVVHSTLMRAQQTYKDAVTRATRVRLVGAAALLTVSATSVPLDRASIHLQREDPSRNAPMVRIPAGRYETGSDSADVAHLMTRYGMRDARVFADEMPRRKQSVRAFWLEATLVTKARFRLFVLAASAWQKGALAAAAHNGGYLEDWSGSDFSMAEAARPVTFVTWPAARAFCAWEGKRLPTEAEWEWAARGGLSDPEFPWGDAPPDAMRANWSGTKLGRTSDVRAFPANGYGLYDMAGNAWQLLENRWAPRAPTDSADDAPSVRHVIHGGSFEGGVVNLRVRWRDSHPSGGAGPHVGFRCARSSQPGAS